MTAVLSLRAAASWLSKTLSSKSLYRLSLDRLSQRFLSWSTSPLNARILPGNRASSCSDSVLGTRMVSMPAINPPSSLDLEISEEQITGHDKTGHRKGSRSFADAQAACCTKENGTVGHILNILCCCFLVLFLMSEVAEAKDSLLASPTGKKMMCGVDERVPVTPPFTLEARAELKMTQKTKQIVIQAKDGHFYSESLKENVIDARALLVADNGAPIKTSFGWILFSVFWLVAVSQALGAKDFAVDFIGKVLMPKAYKKLINYFLFDYVHGAIELCAQLRHSDEEHLT